MFLVAGKRGWSPRPLYRRPCRHRLHGPPRYHHPTGAIFPLAFRILSCVHANPDRMKRERESSCGEIYEEIKWKKGWKQKRIWERMNGGGYGMKSKVATTCPSSFFLPSPGYAWAKYHYSYYASSLFMQADWLLSEVSQSNKKHAFTMHRVPNDLVASSSLL